MDRLYIYIEVYLNFIHGFCCDFMVSLGLRLGLPTFVNGNIYVE